MLKKIIIGLLLITVIGGAVFALTDNQNAAAVAATATPTAITNQQGNGNGNGGNGQTNAQSTPAAQGTQQVQASVNNVGDPWSGSGTLVEVSTVGMTLMLSDGSEVYVELGPQDYWQAQGLTLNVGDAVAVEGFFNGTNYHARTVTANGATIAVRDENGQPLWSGGNNASAGANGGQGEVQIPADQWVTVDGTVTALTNNGLVVRTSDAETLTVSFGRADFWQSQAVTFAANDAISMLGFWQGDQFSVGQVTKTATDERILLRDPNGRPLWAGPGRGQGNGTGASGQSSSTSNQTTANSGQSSSKLLNTSSNQRYASVAQGGTGQQGNSNGKGNGNAGQGNSNAGQQGNGNGNAGQGNGNGNAGQGNGSKGQGNGNGNGGRGNSNRGNGNNGQQQYNQLPATPTPTPTVPAY